MDHNFKAKKESAPKFIDLAEPEYMHKPSPKREKYYPRIRIPKRLKGLSEVGAMKTIRVKVRVRSIELRENSDGGSKEETGLEIRSIEEA